MSSLDSLQTRKLLTRGTVRQSNNDAAVGISLRYKGGGTVTTVAVTTATDITLTTSNGGTDAYTFAALTTVGAVVDAINTDGIFEAKVIDALRSEGSADFFLTSAGVSATLDTNGNTVYNLLVDTSGAATISVALSPSVAFGSPAGHRVHLRELAYFADLTAGANGVQIWQRKGTVESQIFGATSVDTTLTTINFASGNGFITGDQDAELIVHITGTVVNAAGNLVRVVGEIE